MKKITFSQRFRYWFDNIMARGTIALIGWLFIASAIMIAIFSFVIWVAKDGPESLNTTPTYSKLMWMGLMRTLDAGTMGGDEGSYLFLGTMLATTFGGIFMVSTLIGILSSGIEAKLDELRKGRSFIIESGHIVILGWSPQVFAIISELVLANENQKKSCIAILAEEDKVEMEDQIRTRVPNTGRTKIVCRTGSPIDLNDLEIINPHGARAIIVLAPESTDPDPHVIKTILAITNNPNRRPEPYHVVAEMRDPKNAGVARMIGKNEVQLVLTHDLISHITVQTCRRSGLSTVYTDLLDFGGDEIYFFREPTLFGKTFGDALLAYESVVPIGISYANGRTQINPPMDTLITDGDKVIVIAEDDDKTGISNPTPPAINESAIITSDRHPPKPDRTLVLGWNRRGSTIIKELDDYVTIGSEVMVVANEIGDGQEILDDLAGLKNQTIIVQEGDTTDRVILDELNVGLYQHVVVLSYSDRLEPQEADAQTLMTLLHLRDIGDRSGQKFAIVSEMLDVRNRELAEVTRADDFIVSERLVSLMMAQIAENAKLNEVFTELFNPEGSELYMRPAEDYVKSGQSVNFYTVVAAARQRNEVAIGYRSRTTSSAKSLRGDIRLNPAKSDMVTFSEGDQIIVLAED